jgi:hypothetical protein
MGKAARNEARKINATFWNNLAVATMVGGFLIPYLALYPKLYESRGFFDHIPLDAWKSAAGLSLVPMLFAIGLSCLFRIFANRTLRKIED